MNDLLIRKEYFIKAVDKINYGKVVLLVGKVACGKTTFARQMQHHSGVIFLSLDELQLDIFGRYPTREELDNSYSGCFEYQKRLAHKLVTNGLTVYLDWGFWKRSSRIALRKFFEDEGISVEQYYFDIPLHVRIKRNQKRNNSEDAHSFKIEEKDIAFFDSFFEQPEEYENDKVFK
ncbi:AAA family ATPase [Psychromonas sp. KJ10-10]|uniref:AAA family ATPase n=1 Tax=Psychromonas sp. KJ10-10 TaxID=3391823 RepID=UPI0039B6E132